MFDAETARLIRAAPALTGVDPQILPQELTSIYTELVAMRLRFGEEEPGADRIEQIQRLGRIAAIYEAAVDTGADDERRRGAAFVSATAHQLLGRILLRVYGRVLPLLGLDSIHPSVAAPLLFLIAQQNPDAREAAKQLQGVRTDDLLETALIETIHDLATESYDAILARNKQPRGRSETWTEGEVARLAKRAWRMQLHGLAAIIGVIWDTQFSPGDVRSLSEGQQRRDRQGRFFEASRGKTGKAAIGTLSRRAERLIAEYRCTLAIELHSDAPMFRDVRGNAYTTFSLDRDFRFVREAEFPGDKRRLMDMRRSGAVEANAGEVDALSLANKMANSVDRSSKLQDTYLPRRVAVVRIADAARQRGRRVLRENE